MSQPRPVSRSAALPLVPVVQTRRALRALPALTPAAFLLLAVPVARAGEAPTGFSSNHAMGVVISEAGGSSWNLDLSSMLQFDAASGGLVMPTWGTTVGAGWEWVKLDTVSAAGTPTQVDALKWHTAERVGDDSTPWRSTFTIYATGNVDPFLTYAFSARNNTGVAQEYVFTYGESIVPPISGAYDLYADVAGSLTNGIAGSSAKITPTGADTDGDGIAEIQVLRLSNDGGLTFLASGVDVGAEFETGTAAGSTPYGTFTATASGTASAAINYWHIETRFTLSPDRDAAAVSGYVELTARAAVPEPSTWAAIFGALGLGAAAAARRRRNQPA